MWKTEAMEADPEVASSDSRAEMAILSESECSDRSTTSEEPRVDVVDDSLETTARRVLNVVNQVEKAGISVFIKLEAPGQRQMEMYPFRLFTGDEKATREMRKKNADLLKLTLYNILEEQLRKVEDDFCCSVVAEIDGTETVVFRTFA